MTPDIDDSGNLPEEHDEFLEVTEHVASLVKDIGYEEIHKIELPPPEEAAKSDDGQHGEEVQEQGTQSEAQSEQISETEVSRPRPRLIITLSEVGPDFRILAHPEDRYFELQSEYQLWTEIANRLSESRAQSLVEDVSLGSPDDDHPIYGVIREPLEEMSEEERLYKIAAVEFLEEVSNEALSEIIYQLSDIFTRGELKHSVDSTSEGGGVTGFILYHKIFPYEEQFNIADLNNAIERVRMTAHQGELFLRHTFNLGVDIGQTTAGEVSSENVNAPNGPGSEVDVGLGPGDETE